MPRAFPVPSAILFATLLVAAMLFAPVPAMAHTGHGAASGLMHGFLHPLGGLDHVLAMVTVGLIAAQRGGRALWLVPASFMVVMAAGGALGMSGLDLPYVELGIAGSVIAFGLALALGLPLPVLAAMGLAGFFALFHGRAHGAEMPADGAALAYGIGFLAATGLLHATGIGAGAVLARGGTTALRATGAAVAVAGVALIAGIA